MANTAGRVIGGILGGMGKGIYANAEAEGKMQDERRLLEMKLEFEQKRDDLAAQKRAAAAGKVADIYKSATAATETQVTSPNMAGFGPDEVTWTKQQKPSAQDAADSMATNPEFWTAAANAPDAARGILGIASKKADKERNDNEKAAVLNVFNKLRDQYGDEKAAAYANAIVSGKLDPKAFAVDVKDVGGTIYVDGKAAGLTAKQRHDNAKLDLEGGGKYTKSVDRILNAFQSNKGVVDQVTGKFTPTPIDPAYRDIVERAIQMNKTSEGEVLKGLENFNRNGGKFDEAAMPDGTIYRVLPGTKIVVGKINAGAQQKPTDSNATYGKKPDETANKPVYMPPRAWDNRNWNK